MSTRFLNRLVDKAASSEGQQVIYFLRDDFITDELAPIASSRACEPGPGVLDITDTSGTSISINNGKVVCSGAGFTWGDPAIYSDVGFTRQIGLAALYSATRTNTTNLMFGWGVDKVSFGEFSIRNNGGDAYLHNLTAFTLAPEPWTQNVVYTLVIVARSSGMFWLMKGDTDKPEFTIIMVTDDNSDSPLYAAISTSGGTYNADYFRVARLLGVWTTDNGIAVDQKLGGLGDGVTFVHEADCLIEFYISSLPTNPVWVLFRIQDSDNHWFFWVNTLGEVRLYERVGGANNIRGSHSPVVGGERIVIVAVDEEISVYSDNALLFTYSSAVNFKAEVSGNTNVTAGDEGSISDIISWPRVLSGAALNELNKYVL